MSTAVDNRVVSMEFDNAKFEKNVAESLSTLHKLSSSLDSLDNTSTAGFDNITKSIKNMPLDSMADTLDDIAYKFSFLGQVGQQVISGLASEVSNLVLNMVSGIKSISIDQVAAGWSKYEEKTKAVATIMAATGQEIDYVTERLDKLMWYTDETSYDFTEMANSIGKFTATGADLDDSLVALQGIANWAAISGQNTQKASMAMYNLSQAMSLGEVRVQDWKSIELANMATLEFKETALTVAEALGTVASAVDEVGNKYYIALDEMGETTGDWFDAESMRDTLKKGWFDKDVLLTTLNIYGQFGDGLSYISDATGKYSAELISDFNEIEAGTLSVSGMYEKYRESIDESGMSMEEFITRVEELTSSDWDMQLSRKAYEAAQEAKTFTDAINAVKDAVSSSWMRVFEDLFGNYEEATDFWTDIANRLVEVFIAPADAIHELLSEANSGVKLTTNKFDYLEDVVIGTLSTTDTYVEHIENLLRGAGFDIDSLISKYGDLDTAMNSDEFNEWYANHQEFAETLERLDSRILTQFHTTLTSVLRDEGVEIDALAEKYEGLENALHSDEIVEWLNNNKQVFSTIFRDMGYGTDDGRSFDLIEDKVFDSIKSTETYATHVQNLLRGAGLDIDSLIKKYGDLDKAMNSEEYTEWISKNESFKKTIESLETRTATQFYDSLAESMRDQGFEIDKLIEKYGNLKKALHSFESIEWLWNNQSAVTSALEGMGFGVVNGFTLIDFSSKDFDAIEDTILDSIKTTNDYATHMSNLLRKAGFDIDSLIESYGSLDAAMNSEEFNQWYAEHKDFAKTTEIFNEGTLTKYHLALADAMREDGFEIDELIRKYGTLEKALHSDEAMDYYEENSSIFSKVLNKLGLENVDEIKNLPSIVKQTIGSVHTVEESIAAANKIAKEINWGMWGYGEEQTKRLEEAGYNAEYMQELAKRWVNSNPYDENNRLVYYEDDRFGEAMHADASKVWKETSEGAKEAGYSVTELQNIIDSYDFANIAPKDYIQNGFLNTLESVTNTIEAIKLGIAQISLPITPDDLRNVASRFYVISEYIKELSENALKYGSPLRSFVEMLGRGAAFIINIGRGLLTFVTPAFQLFMMILNPIGKAIQLLGTFGRVFDQATGKTSYVYRILSSISSIISSLLDSVSKAFSNAGELLGFDGWIERLESGEFYQGIIKFLKKFEAIPQAFEETADKIKNSESLEEAIEVFLTGIGGAIATVFNVLTSLDYSAIFSAIGSAIVGALSAVWMLISSAATGLVNGIKGLFNKIKEIDFSKFFAKIGEGIITGGAILAVGIWGIAHKIWDGIKAAGSWIMDQLTNFSPSAIWEKFFKFIEETLTEIQNGLKENYEPTIQKISEKTGIEAEKIHTILDPFYNAIVELNFDDLKAKVEEKFAKFGEIFSPITNAFKGVGKALKTVFETGGNFFRDWKIFGFEKALKLQTVKGYGSEEFMGAFEFLYNKVVDLRAKILGLKFKLENIFQDIKNSKFVQGIINFYNNLKTEIANIATLGWNWLVYQVTDSTSGLRRFITFCKEKVNEFLGFLEEHSWTFAKIAFGLAEALKVLKKYELFKLFKDYAELPMEGLKKLLGIKDTFVDGIEAFASFADAFGKAILKVAIAVAIFSFLDPDGLQRGLKAVLAITALLGIIAVVLAAVTKNTEGVVDVKNKQLNFGSSFNYIGLGSAIVALAVGVRIIASAIKKLAGLDEDEFEAGISRLKSIAILLGEFMFALYLVSKSMSIAGKNGKGLSLGSGNLKGTGLALIGMAIALYIVVGAVKKIVDMDLTEDDIKTFKAVFTRIGVIMSVMALASGKSNFRFSNGVGLIAMAIALRIVVGAVKSIAELNLTFEDIGKITLVELGITAMMGLMSLAAGLGKFKFSNALGLLVMVVAIKQMVKVVRSISDLLVDDDAIKRMSIATAMFAIIASAMAILSWQMGSALGASKLNAGALVAFAAAIVAMYAVVGALKLLDGVNVDWTTILQLLAGMGIVILSYLAIQAITKLFPTTSISGLLGLVAAAGVFLLVAIAFKKLDGVKIDPVTFDKLSKACWTVVGLFAGTVVALNLFKKYVLIAEGILLGLGFVLNVIGEGIWKAGEGIKSIGEGFNLIADSISKISTFDEETIEKAMKNMSLIFSKSKSSLDIATNGNTTWFGNIWRSYEDVFGDVGGGLKAFFSDISEILDNMTALANFKVGDLHKAMLNMKIIFSSSHSALDFASDGNETWLGNVWRSYEDVFGDVKGGLNVFFKDMKELISGMNSLAGFSQTKLNTALENMKTIFRKSRTALDTATNGNETLLGNIWRSYEDVFGDVSGGVSTFFTDIASVIDSMKALGSDNTGAIEQALTNMQLIFASSAEGMDKLTEPLIKEGTLYQAYDSYETLFSGTGRGLATFFSEVGGVLEQMKALAEFPFKYLRKGMSRLIFIFGKTGIGIDELVSPSETWFGKIITDYDYLMTGVTNGLTSFFGEKGIPSILSGMETIANTNEEMIGKAMGIMESVFRSAGDTGTAGSETELESFINSYDRVVAGITAFFNPDTGIPSVLSQLMLIGSENNSSTIDQALEVMKHAFASTMWGDIYTSIGTWFTNITGAFDGMDTNNLQDSVQRLVDVLGATTVINGSTVKNMTILAEGLTELGKTENAVNAFFVLDELFSINSDEISKGTNGARNLVRFGNMMNTMRDEIPNIKEALIEISTLGDVDEDGNLKRGKSKIIDDAMAIIDMLFAKGTTLYKIGTGDIDFSKIEGMGTAIQTGLEGLSDSIKDYDILTSVKNLMSNAITGIKDTRAAWKTTGTYIISCLIDGIKNSKNNIISVCKTTMSSAITAVKDTKAAWKSAGTLLGKNVSYGIDDTSSTIVGSIKAALGEAWMAGYNTLPAWNTLGQMITAGLSSGMTGTEDTATYAAVELSASVVEAAAKTMGVCSPSKVFMKIGEYVSQGLAIGIRNDQGEAETAAEALANSAIATATTAEELICNILESDSQPTIRPVLDLSGIQARAASIDSMIGSANLDTSLLANKASAVSSSIDIAKEKIQNASNQTLTATLDATSLQAILANTNKPIQVNTNIAYEGSLAQLATVLHPYIKNEANRIGPSFVNSNR